MQFATLLNYVNMSREQFFMFHSGAFAVIVDKERRVLWCHRRDQDLWNLPGGRVRAFEAPWEGVVREVKEEIGLTVKPKRIIDISSQSCPI
jgi:8-oxo-dGTP pyrophosphatase MutT (NUDIX family)